MTKVESLVTSLGFFVLKDERVARGLSCRKISPGIYRFRAAGTVPVRRSSTVLVQLCDPTVSEQALCVVQFCPEHGLFCPPTRGEYGEEAVPCARVEKLMPTSRWMAAVRMREDSFDVCLLARPRARTIAGAKRPPRSRDGYFGVMVLGT